MATADNLNPMSRPPCDIAFEYAGTRDFHEGPGGGFFANRTEMFMNKGRFDVYVCPRRGRVELFMDGIGEEFRSQEPV